jgi:hypothetical protein
VLNARQEAAAPVAALDKMGVSCIRLTDYFLDSRLRVHAQPLRILSSDVLFERETQGGQVALAFDKDITEMDRNRRTNENAPETMEHPST